MILYVSHYAAVYKVGINNYFNILTVFKVFLRLTMHKQPK